LDRAILLATSIHNGTLDKGGKPYILHPLHVMNQLMYDPELAQMGVLHDTVEDGDITFQSLRDRGYSSRVVAGLVLLTHDPVDTYDRYITKMVDNYDVIRVKRKDLTHNSSITRLKSLVDAKGLERIAKYQRAYQVLGAAKQRFLT
jgi:(p)ppGpp synthase/HD superfamily hydrolase